MEKIMIILVPSVYKFQVQIPEYYNYTSNNDYITTCNNSTYSITNQYYNSIYIEDKINEYKEFYECNCDYTISYYDSISKFWDFLYDLKIYLNKEFKDEYILIQKNSYNEGFWNLHFQYSESLNKFTEWYSNFKLNYKVGIIKNKDEANYVYNWCKNELKGKWCNSGFLYYKKDDKGIYYIENLAEATLFKLKWENIENDV